MVITGDGQKRSETRKRKNLICLRVSDAEKRAVQLTARNAGYNSTGAFLRSTLTDSRPAATDVRIHAGQLSYHGAALTKMAETLASRGQQDLSEALHKLSAETAQIQREMLKGDNDDR